MRAADRLCSERFGIDVEWLMEAAGWRVARACQGRSVVVVCGRGNNGGDALAAARHLHAWDRLKAVCAAPAAFAGAAAAQARALERLGVKFDLEPDLSGADQIVDGIFGTGLSRPPEGRFANWIEAINASGLPVVAVDVPSGLDSDSGVAHAPTVRASATVTLALPKRGLLAADGPRVSGQVWVADIGIPPQVFDELGVDIPVRFFEDADSVRLR